MDDCDFCQIVADEKDAYVLAETDLTVAFLDGNPASLGHTLVVPKAHSEFLFSDEAVAGGVFQTVQRIVKAMNQILEPDGISMFHTSGPLIGNITHSHVHVVPRYVDDNITISLPGGGLNHEEATELAGRFRTKF